MRARLNSGATRIDLVLQQTPNQRTKEHVAERANHKQRGEQEQREIPKTDQKS